MTQGRGDARQFVMVQSRPARTSISKTASLVKVYSTVEKLYLRDVEPLPELERTLTAIALAYLATPGRVPTAVPAQLDSD